MSRELSGVLTSLRDADLTGVGTPSVDPAVASGMADLQQALTRLQGTADACIAALRRHGVEDPSQSTSDGSGDSA